MQVGGRPVVELPEKRIHVVKVAMAREQRAQYERWAAAARLFVEAHLDADTLLRHYSSVLEALLRCGPRLMHVFALLRHSSRTVHRWSNRTVLTAWLCVRRQLRP